MKPQLRTQRLFDELTDLTRLMSPLRQVLLQKFDLSKHQLLALYTIGRNQPVTVGDVAQQLTITSGATTQMIDVLEEKGLVERRSRAEDRRVIEVKLSEEGEKVLYQVKTMHRKEMDLLLAEVSDEDLAALVGVVHKIRKTLERQKDKD